MTGILHLRFVDCAASIHMQPSSTLESGYFAVGALCGGTDVRKGTISERTVSSALELNYLKYLAACLIASESEPAAATVLLVALS